MWRLNPRAQENLSSLGLWAALLLGSVSAFCARSNRTSGVVQGRGHWLAIGLIAANLIGGVTDVLPGTAPRAIVGISNRRCQTSI